MNSAFYADADDLSRAALSAVNEFSGGWRPYQKPLPDPTYAADDELMIVRERQACDVL